MISALAAAVALGSGCSNSTKPPDVVDTSFNIEIRYHSSNPSAEVRAAFNAAAARIQAIITADLTATKLNNLNLAPDSVCGIPVTMNETVDDLVIYATVKTIDGVGKVQASSGPCLVRAIGKLPVVGRMEMDVEDLNQLASTGRLDAVILHEMLHVVGFGTIWEDVSPARITGPGSQDPRFNGPQAIQGCTSAGGTTICASGVPVENCTGLSGCGAGTRDAHWRELTFRSELMTGFVEAQNVAMPLSAMSILSLGDVGYSVTAAGAEAYKIPGTALRVVPEDGSGVSVPIWETVRRARVQVGVLGAVSGFSRRTGSQ